MQEIVAEPRWRKEKARLAKLPAGGGERMNHCEEEGQALHQ